MKKVYVIIEIEDNEEPHTIDNPVAWGYTGPLRRFCSVGWTRDTAMRITKIWYDGEIREVNDPTEWMHGGDKE